MEKVREEAEIQHGKPVPPVPRWHGRATSAVVRPDFKSGFRVFLGEIVLALGFLCSLLLFLLNSIVNTLLKDELE